MSDPLRVLVVDDEQALAGVIASYLEREGFAVDLAHDGPAAVAAAREHRPDLVVLDVMLPGFDGIEVCRQTRRDGHRGPIIVISARGSEPDRVRALDAGADLFLSKPFPLAELARTIAGLVDRAGGASST